MEPEELQDLRKRQIETDSPLLESTDSNSTSSQCQRTQPQNRPKPKNKQKKPIVKDWFGFWMQILTNFFLIISNFIIFHHFIARWFWEENINLQLIRGIPLEPVGLSLFVFYEVVFVLTFISYQLASFSDPGYMTTKIPAPTHIIQEQYLKFCTKCPDNKWKPQRAHHCKICQECVYRMDHHCNWVNNCVGIKNQKYFCIFLFYAFILCILFMIYMLFSGILRFIQIDKFFIFILSISWRHAICGIMWLASIFFIYMTIEFITDQIDSIQMNQTTVESHKKLFGKPDTFFNLAKQIFGENKLTWFLPIKPVLKCNYLEMLYSEEKITQLLEENGEFIETLYEDTNEDLYPLVQQYQIK